ncbi:MAG: SH3 domain-containing protein [Oscillospiraceae bacterium]
MGNILKRVISSAMVCLIGVTGANLTNIDFPINSINVSATDDYTTWRQGDSRWSSMRLGTSGYTMSNSGCAVTSLAKLMVMSGSVTDSSFNPGTLCSYFNQNGGFSSAGDISWGVSHRYASSFTFEGYDDLDSNSNSGKANEIKELLDEGYYIILGVKSGGHWVAVDKVEGNNIYAYDPANGKYINVFDAYSSSGIYKIRKFRGANSKPLPQEVTNTQEEIVEELPNITDDKKSEDIKNTNESYSKGLYKLTYELCLRTDEFSNADVIDIIPVNTDLNVSDVEGNWGYVCYNGNMGWINLNYAKKIQNGFNYSTGIYTNAEPLNYRESNSTDAEIYGVIPADTQIKVTQVRDNWGKTTYDGETAWICLDYVSAGYSQFSSATNIAISNSRYELGVYEVEENLNLRKEASTSSDKLDLIDSETTLNVISIDGNWGKVVYDNQVGWICLDYANQIDDFSEYIPYDMNGDGRVNIADVYYISDKLKHDSDFTAREFHLIDFDDNGSIDYDDYTTFKTLLLS